MKTDWTLYIYRRDRRYKTGERLFSITVWPGLDRDGINRTVMGVLLPAIAVGPNSTRVGALGVTQA
jgi:hypothetical protein